MHESYPRTRMAHRLGKQAVPDTPESDNSHSEWSHPVGRRAFNIKGPDKTPLLLLEYRQNHQLGLKDLVAPDFRLPEEPPAHPELAGAVRLLRRFFANSLPPGFQTIHLGFVNAGDGYTDTHWSAEKSAVEMRVALPAAGMDKEQAGTVLARLLRETWVHAQHHACHAYLRSLPGPHVIAWGDGAEVRMLSPSYASVAKALAQRIKDHAMRHAFRLAVQGDVLFQLDALQGTFKDLQQLVYSRFDIDYPNAEAMRTAKWGEYYEIEYPEAAAMDKAKEAVRAEAEAKEGMQAAARAGEQTFEARADEQTAAALEPSAGNDQELNKWAEHAVAAAGDNVALIMQIFGEAEAGNRIKLHARYLGVTMFSNNPEAAQSLLEAADSGDQDLFDAVRMSLASNEADEEGAENAYEAADADFRLKVYDPVLDLVEARGETALYEKISEAFDQGDTAAVLRYFLNLTNPDEHQVAAARAAEKVLDEAVVAYLNATQEAEAQGMGSSGQ